VVLFKGGGSPAFLKHQRHCGRFGTSDYDRLSVRCFLAAWYQEASIVTLIAGLWTYRLCSILPVFVRKDNSSPPGDLLMMQACVFCICSVLFIVVSLLTPPPLQKKLKALLGNLSP